MKLLLVVTLLACSCGALGDGLIPKIKLPASVDKMIPDIFKLPLDLVNKGLDTLNGMLDFSKWKDVLSTGGEAGKEVYTTVMSLVKLFQSGDFTSPFAVADVANEAYHAVIKVQDAIKKVNDIPLYIPFLGDLNNTLETMKGNLKLARCIRPTNCVPIPTMPTFFGGLWKGRRR